MTDSEQTAVDVGVKRVEGVSLRHAAAKICHQQRTRPGSAGRERPFVWRDRVEPSRSHPARAHHVTAAVPKGLAKPRRCEGIVIHHKDA